ncbi:MAG: cell division protein SepF [Nanopusillaceae archaeon]
MVSLGDIFKRKKSESEDKYLEVVPTQKEEEVNIYVRIFRLKDSSEVKAVVDSLRERNYIAIVDISALNVGKDLIEVKKVVSRLRTVIETIGGDIAAIDVGGNKLIIATPPYVKIWRGHQMSAVEEVKKEGPTNQ